MPLVVKPVWRKVGEAGSKLFLFYDDAGYWCIGENYSSFQFFNEINIYSLYENLNDVPMSNWKLYKQDDADWFGDETLSVEILGSYEKLHV